MAVRILRVVALVAILAGLAGSFYFGLPAYRLPPAGSGELGNIEHLPAAAGVLTGGAILLLMLRWVPPPGPRRGSAVAYWFSLPPLVIGAGASVFSGLFLAILQADLRRSAARRYDDSLLGTSMSVAQTGLQFLGTLAGAAMMVFLCGALLLLLFGFLFFGLSLWLRRRKPTPVV